MLLMTNRGERLMLPEYGTNLRQIIFQQNVAGIESMIQQEVVDAITAWEPRVILQSINVDRRDDKSVVVTAAFISKLSQTGFSTNLIFQP
jgi:phage baseplate assembly protein W